MHCQIIKPDFLHASVCLKEILPAFNGTVTTSSDIIHSSSNTQKQYYPEKAGLLREYNTEHVALSAQ